MENDLKALVQELVLGEAHLLQPTATLPQPEVIESDSEEAWNDFQDSQIAFEQAFQDSKLGSV